MTQAILQSKRVEAYLIKTPLTIRKKKIRKKFLVKRWGDEGIEDESEMGSPTEQSFKS